MKKVTFILILVLLCGCSAKKDLAEQKKKQKNITVYLIGDSTCANKRDELRPETGWGEKIHLFFNDNVTIDNRALNGRSTKTFRSGGHWDKVMSVLKDGDWVIVQFGHNDGKKDSPTVGTTFEEYQNNLAKYIDEIRSKGAHPIIMTPVSRRSFVDGVLTYTHRDYPKYAKEIAEKKSCALIDMEKKTHDLISGMGIEESKKLYVWATVKEYPHLKKDRKDNTHFCDYGALKVAELTAEGIKELTPNALSESLK